MLLLLLFLLMLLLLRVVVVAVAVAAVFVASHLAIIAAAAFVNAAPADVVFVAAYSLHFPSRLFGWR